MNLHYSIPLKQRRTQHYVDQFNADEQIWMRLQSERRLRRRACRGLPADLHEVLDLLEFLATRPPQDCIGSF